MKEEKVKRIYKGSPEIQCVPADKFWLPDLPAANPKTASCRKLQYTLQKGSSCNVFLFVPSHESFQCSAQVSTSQHSALLSCLPYPRNFFSFSIIAKYYHGSQYLLWKNCCRFLCHFSPCLILHYYCAEKLTLSTILVIAYGLQGEQDETVFSPMLQVDR